MNEKFLELLIATENEEYVFGTEESYGYLVGTHARFGGVYK